MNFDSIFHAADAETRRSFLSTFAQRAFGLAALPSLGHLAASLPQDTAPQDRSGEANRSAPQLGTATAQSVIYVFLKGGMSHLDTFDTKPGAKTQGPVKSISTSADGVQLSEHFPVLAKQMHHVALINSMSSTVGAHEQAQYLMRTSYEMRGTIKHPGLGTWCNAICGSRNESLPGHVVISGGAEMISSGFFPPTYLPLPIGNPEEGLQNSSRSKAIDEKTFAKRLELLKKMNEAFAARYPQRPVRAYTEGYEAAVDLMRSPDLIAFDTKKESDAIRQAYGEDAFGRGCMLARRLVEHGVRYVEIGLGGWDTHNQNFEELGDKCPALDRGLGTLIADLDARGLLRETMVVVATEFGRTPDITKDNNGRNHYPKAFSTLMAGGGIRGGLRFGKTDAEGREVVEKRVTIQDFNATIATALGIPLKHIEHSPSGRPFTAADKGRPVLELLA